MSRNQSSEVEVDLSGECLEALLTYADQLSEFEREEIVQYNPIFYVAERTKKILGKTLEDYHDEHGFYRERMGDHISYRFEVLQTVGKGSFGLVLRCFDHWRHETVALKILRNQRRFHEQGLVEVKILTHLKALDADHAFGLLHIKEHFCFRSHLCITFELLG